MADISNENEIREHLRFCINEAQNRFAQRRGGESDRAFKLKSWALTVFIATAAFCITQKEELGFVFYFLPLIPVILFWLLYVYESYLVDRHSNHKDFKMLNEVLANLYDYPIDELKNHSRDLLQQEYDWPKKGKANLKRFFCVKFIPLCKGFVNLSNLLFFLPMVIVWIVIIFCL